MSHFWRCWGCVCFKASGLLREKDRDRKSRLWSAREVPFSWRGLHSLNIYYILCWRMLNLMCGPELSLDISQRSHTHTQKKKLVIIMRMKIVESLLRWFLNCFSLLYIIENNYILSEFSTFELSRLCVYLNEQHELNLLLPKRTNECLTT